MYKKSSRFYYCCQSYTTKQQQQQQQQRRASSIPIGVVVVVIRARFRRISQGATTRHQRACNHVADVAAWRRFVTGFRLLRWLDLCGLVVV
jgi:hypothetical protein